MAGALTGHRVLVTRPAERAEGLIEAIEAEGGHALRFPTIAIEPVAEAAAPAPLDAYAAVLFVSPAAVTHGIAALGLAPAIAPPTGAVGRATAKALAAHGFHAAIEPVGGQDSNGLLRAPALQDDRVAGRRILIVRGEGGREDLAEGLMARGAAVDYAEVYRRSRPSGLDPAVAAQCDIVTATSVEGVTNLLVLLDPATRGHVQDRPIAVNSERIAAAARANGFSRDPVVAAQPGDAGLLAAIRRCVSPSDAGPSESA